MKLILVPGFESLFGKPEKTYEEFLEGIPSSAVIAVMIMLNAELNAPIDRQKNQRRLREVIAERFGQDRIDDLNNRTKKYYLRSQKRFSGYIFGRRYLLAMVVRELGRNDQSSLVDTTPDQEYNILMAYLLTVDNVNKNDSLSQPEPAIKKDDPLFPYRLLWMSQVGQFLFNENPNLAFEIVKLLYFASWANVKYPTQLREYITKYRFDSIGSFIHSFYQIAMATLEYNEHTIFSKLSYISPLSNIPEDHLAALSINKELGNSHAGLRHIKLHPLYYDPSGKYMVIDHDLYAKKMYKGPFFELLKATSLKKAISFENYSSTVTYELNEQIIFKNTLSALRGNKYDILHFDNKSDNIPDCYFRHGAEIVLVEFKSYQFPDDLIDNTDFDKLKTYFDTRFIQNKDGKAKGIKQLAKQIELLQTGDFDFDKLPGKNTVNIYPVICTEDFYFSLPGLNEYLNDRFLQEVEKMQNNRYKIHPVTMISLSTLFDIGMRRASFRDITDFIKRYWKIIANRVELNKKTRTVESFLQTKSSFDEIYETKIRDRLKKVDSTKWIDEHKLGMMGVSFEELNTPFDKV